MPVDLYGYKLVNNRNRKKPVYKLVISLIIYMSVF